MSNRYDKILCKPCLICGKENRYHRIFWSPRGECYIRQVIEEYEHPLVPSSDHYAIVDNLVYLEWKVNQNEASK